VHPLDDRTTELRDESVATREQWDMGLMLARVGHAMSGPGVKTIAGLTAGLALGTGVVMADQYAYGADFSHGQSKPEGINHVVGAGGAAIGLAGMIGTACWAMDYTERHAKPGVMLSAGFGVGAAAGAYLLAPVLRRWSAEH
jgi:hypothetical protein